MDQCPLLRYQLCYVWLAEQQSPTHVHVGQKRYNNANVLKFFIPEALNVDEGQQGQDSALGVQKQKLEPNKI